MAINKDKKKVVFQDSQNELKEKSLKRGEKEVVFRVPIKPLSVNSAYRGRRFSTPELHQYKRDVSLLLPNLEIPQGKRLKVSYVFGVSSKNSDGDNLVKAFQDIISEQYGFNDKTIYSWSIEKVDVEKGEEFIDFSIGLYFSKTRR